ncbi:MAG: beta-N-acetylhexosaminidase [Aquisalimonadaceae bacterium]
MTEPGPGQLMVGIAGTQLSPREENLLRHPQIAGVILFSRNYRDPDQLALLTAAIHAVRTPVLLVGVDQEGGRVQRFREPFTRLPPAGRLGVLHDRDPRAALDSARAFGWLMASELLAVGVDLSFAPVLDLDRGISDVIGDRALHRDPVVVSALAMAMVEGMHQAGMRATGKHFPGHGGVAPDSHLELPVDDRPELELRGSDIRPFEALLQAGVMDALMTAHVAYPEADIRPASFSRYWVTSVLREDLGYDGVVIADDLGMEGAAAIGDLAARARVALEAGVDLVMLCNQLDVIQDVLDAMDAEPDPTASRRIARLRGRINQFDLPGLRQSTDWIRARQLLDALGTG